jgi:hypothetical protein
MNMRAWKIACAALLVSATASAQDDSAGRKVAVEVAARVPFEKAVKGAPYSAETVIESTQTLADGNRINRKTTGRVYRDGEGRTRREDDREPSTITAMTTSGAVTSRRTMISIVDPIAGFSYSLDPENKIAWKTSMGAAGTIMNKVEVAMVEQRMKVELDKVMTENMANMSDEDKAKLAQIREREKATAQEQIVARGGGGGGGRGGMIARSGTPPVMPAGHDGNVSAGPLEHKTLEGVPVEGRKTTTTIPAGQVGNEQPLTIVSEEWRSPDLNVLVLTKHSDPRTGESTYRLQNIVRAEPDRSLFMVPADYTIKETGIRKMEEARRR